MSKFCAIVLLSIGLLLGGGAAKADTFSFSALPTGGTTNGTPGSTVDWGYSITNNSSTQWLLLLALNTTQSFFNGTPNNNVFSYPLLAPNQTLTATNGLFEFTWNTNAPIGFTNSGLFDLTGLFCTDSTLSNCSSSVLDVYSSYSATVTPVPEPAPLLLLPPCLALCWVLKKMAQA